MRAFVWSENWEKMQQTPHEGHTNQFEHFKVAASCVHTVSVSKHLHQSPNDRATNTVMPSRRKQILEIRPYNLDTFDLCARTVNVKISLYLCVDTLWSPSNWYNSTKKHIKRTNVIRYSRHSKQIVQYYDVYQTHTHKFESDAPALWLSNNKWKFVEWKKKEKTDRRPALLALVTKHTTDTRSGHVSNKNSIEKC